jgi:23S rRNA (adenine2503-C2)-methyltransferase
VEPTDITADAPAAPALPDLRDLGFEGTRALVASLGEAPYRAQQVFRAVHGRAVRSVDEMTDLSRTLRGRLQGAARLGGLQVCEQRPSGDGSIKLVFGLQDGKRVESVLIPERDDDTDAAEAGDEPGIDATSASAHQPKLTQCISTQAGCPLACSFCLTGALGLARNLTVGEIVDQVHLGRQIAATLPGPRGTGRRISNLVFMGMGEPFLNYAAVVDAVGILTHDFGPGMSHRRITISTAGVVPSIGRYGAEARRANLAISLNATTDAVRDEIMPINKKWDIATLLAALRAFPLEPRRRLTFEYVLLAGVNDSDDDADRLVRLLRGFRCKVNLIPFNPHPASPYARPAEDRIRSFQAQLRAGGLAVYLRDNRGNDVLAACGQLGDLGHPFRESRAVKDRRAILPVLETMASGVDR